MAQDDRKIARAGGGGRKELTERRGHAKDRKRIRGEGSSEQSHRLATEPDVVLSERIDCESFERARSAGLPTGPRIAAKQQAGHRGDGADTRFAASNRA